MNSTRSRVLLIFPPFVESALVGPHLAPGLLGAVLRNGGVDAHVRDFNIRAVRHLIQSDIAAIAVAATRESTGAHLSARELAALDWLKLAAREAWITQYPSSLTYALRVIRRVLFPVPSCLEACMESSIASNFAAAVYGDILDEALRVAPHVVGFSVAFSEQLNEAIQFARMIRLRMPEMPILLGGSQINLLESAHIEILAQSGLFDSILTPNGEPAILDLVKTAARRPTAAVVSARALTHDDLIGLPHPTFDSVDLYFRPLTIPVLATKGCYWGKCTFCDYVRLSDIGTKRYLARSVEETLAGIAHSHLTWHPDRIMLISDAVPPGWYQRLAKAAIASEIDLRTWSYMMHHDHLDRPFFDILKRAGVQGINFGTENTNPRILRLMRKEAGPNAIRRNLRDAHDSGLTVVSNVIPDYPTLTFAEALRVANDFHAMAPTIDVLNPSMFDLTSGTVAADRPAEHGLVVSKDAYCRSSHGFHSLPFTEGGGLDDRQRMVLRLIYSRLAAAVKLRRRIAKFGFIELDEEDCLIFDRGVMRVSSDPPSYKIPALGLSVILEDWQDIFVREIVEKRMRRFKVCDLRLAAPVEARSGVHWLRTFVNSGIICDVERVPSGRPS